MTSPRKAFALYAFSSDCVFLIVMVILLANFSDDKAATGTVPPRSKPYLRDSGSEQANSALIEGVAAASSQCVFVGIARRNGTDAT